MSFYWECLGQKYPFDPSKTYLIYYKACFGPPHKGHFNTVKRFTNIGDNIHVMVHQMGSESRHGVPRYLNREIWKTYIKELLPQNRVHLCQYYHSDDILSLPILDQIDTVVYIRGNEGYNIESTPDKDKKIFSHIMRKLRLKNINMDFYYLERPLVKVLSATIFTEKLIKTRGKCLKHGCDCKYKRLKYFYPRGLDRGIIMKITNKLQKQNLK